MSPLIGPLQAVARWPAYLWASVLVVGMLLFLALAALRLRGE